MRYYYKDKHGRSFLNLTVPLSEFTVQPEPTENDENGNPIVPDPIPQFDQDECPIFLNDDGSQLRGYVSITKEEWDAHEAESAHDEEADGIDVDAMVENGRKRRLIAELKGNLAATDYQAIKFAEGAISAEEYADMKAQRQAWRDEINQLESELGGR